jgi:hypothetical protein
LNPKFDLVNLIDHSKSIISHNWINTHNITL